MCVVVNCRIRLSREAEQPSDEETMARCISLPAISPGRSESCVLFRFPVVPATRYRRRNDPDGLISLLTRNTKKSPIHVSSTASGKTPAPAYGFSSPARTPINPIEAVPLISPNPG